jgi:hypothetical protein
MCLEQNSGLPKFQLACPSVHGSQIGSLSKALHTPMGPMVNMWIIYILSSIVFYQNSSTFLFFGIYICAQLFDFDHKQQRHRGPHRSNASE